MNGLFRKWSNLLIVLVIVLMVLIDWRLHVCRLEIEAENKRIRRELRYQYNDPQQEWMLRNGWVQGPPGSGWYKDNKPYQSDEK